MATIEPRLIHLLNGDSKSPPHAANHDLPPLQTLAFPKSSTRSLPLPLEPNTGQRGDNSAPQGLFPQIPSLYSAVEESIVRQDARKDTTYSKERQARPTGSGYPLSLLLENTDISEQSHSLRMILDDNPDGLEDPATKKRHRALTVKDDFVQLPQPLKKQKATQQVVPPIINGLHEPPPNAAVFPPIASGSFDDAEAVKLNMLQDYGTAVDDRMNYGHAVANESEKVSFAKAKRRAAKPRRKWSEEETNHLLLGVSRHGVGKWTSILDDPDFTFNDRTAGDLKDRFRTCCPNELRGKLNEKVAEMDGTDQQIAESRSKAIRGILLESILIESDELGEKDKPANDSDTIPKQQKRSRAHRKKMEDLAELGIRGPFKKSHRRERRPFTEQDDKEILEGLDQYGPAWTKIQRDAKFNLSSRQPTDLRDRVRNKYPEIYARIEKGSFQPKDNNRGNNLLEPSVNTTIENSLNVTKSGPLEPHLNCTGSKEDMLKWPRSSSLHESGDVVLAGQNLEAAEPASSALMGNNGEMDISRLLLTDTQV